MKIYTFIADLYGVEQPLYDEMLIQHVLDDVIKVGGFHVFKECFVKFPGDNSGITGFIVIGESHISIHTWPEKSYISFTIESCTARERTKSAFDKFLDSFTYSDKKVQFIEREF